MVHKMAAPTHCKPRKKLRGFPKIQKDIVGHDEP
jgi:hypothetical protein